MLFVTSPFHLSGHGRTYDAQGVGRVRSPQPGRLDCAPRIKTTGEISTTRSQGRLQDRLRDSVRISREAEAKARFYHDYEVLAR